jgi:Mce-associated membrane protein
VAVSAGVARLALLHRLPFGSTGFTGCPGGRVECRRHRRGGPALLCAETLEADFGNAKALLTVIFMNYYNQFTTEVVTTRPPDRNRYAPRRRVVRKAIISFESDNAGSCCSQPDDDQHREHRLRFSASAVKVGLQKSDGAWLISAFDPL